MINAHKVIDSLRRNSVGHVPSDERETAERHLLCVSEAIHKAGKFDLGILTDSDADVLRDTGIEQLQEGILALPFPYTYWEYTIDTKEDGLVYKYCVSMPYLDYVSTLDPNYLGNEQEFMDLHGGVVDMPDLDKTTILIVMGAYQGGYRSMTKHSLVGVRSDDIVTFSVINSPLCRAAGDALTFKDDETIVSVAQASIGLLQAMLNARGMDVTTELAPERLNKARIKKGRVPLYEHHTVKIGGISSSGNVIGVGMDRASPRKHFRRGHIRVLHRGDINEKKTVIPACLINGRGFISKEYTV